MKKYPKGALEAKLVEYLDAEMWTTTADLSAATQTTRSSVSHALARLKKRGVIVSERYAGGKGEMRHKLNSRRTRRPVVEVSTPSEVFSSEALIARVTGDMDTLMTRLGAALAKAEAYDKLVARLEAAGITMTEKEGSDDY